jgi:hypothetical protein
MAKEWIRYQGKWWIAIGSKQGHPEISPIRSEEPPYQDLLCCDLINLRRGRAC